MDALSLALPDIATRLAIATAFGMMLGIDRQLRGKSAGLRTHMLIALGAAATTLIALDLYGELLRINPNTRADPLRAIGGVMAAVGFLGAGAIIRGGERPHNMTTAANIWLCGAIGLACGAGDYGLAVLVFGFTLMILTVVRLFEGRSVKPRIHHDSED